MIATAAVPATARVEVLGLWKPAQLKGLGHMLGDGLLDVMDDLLSVEETLRNGIIEKVLALLLKGVDLIHVHHHSRLLLVLQDRPLLAEFAVLSLYRFVAHEGVDLTAQFGEVRLLKNGLA